MCALNKGSNLDNSLLEQEFTAAGAGWRKGKGNAVKGALTPLLGQAAITRIPVSGQDYSCKSKQLHPLQRGGDTESFHSLLLLKSTLPCLWHCLCETRDSSLQFMQHHQLQDISRLAVEIGIEWLCSKNVTATHFDPGYGSLPWMNWPTATGLHLKKPPSLPLNASTGLQAAPEASEEPEPGSLYWTADFFGTNAWQKKKNAFTFLLPTVPQDGVCLTSMCLLIW